MKFNTISNVGLLAGFLTTFAPIVSANDADVIYHALKARGVPEDLIGAVQKLHARDATVTVTVTSCAASTSDVIPPLPPMSTGTADVPGVPSSAGTTATAPSGIPPVITSGTATGTGSVPGVGSVTGTATAPAGSGSGSGTATATGPAGSGSGSGSATATATGPAGSGSGSVTGSASPSITTPAAVNGGAVAQINMGLIGLAVLAGLY